MAGALVMPTFNTKITTARLLVPYKASEGYDPVEAANKRTTRTKAHENPHVYLQAMRKKATTYSSPGPDMENISKLGQHHYHYARSFICL